MDHLYANEQDFFADSPLIFDMDHLKSVQPYALETSDDVELTRAHFDKPVKHGVMPLDPNVFKVYTKTLMHAKSAMRSQKVRQELFKDLDTGSRDEININSATSLL